MRIALVHDYIKEYGGAERVLEALHEIWPEAPVYTTVYLPQFLGPHRKRFDGWDIRPSFLQNIPFIHKLISPARLLAPWVFENIDLSDYDAVIVSATGAYCPNLLVRKPSTVHIAYYHTPPRYLYGYPTARNWQKNPVGKFFGELANHWLREIDFLSAQRPDVFIANSEEVKRRINKFYRRDATVIYPPVTVISKFQIPRLHLPSVRADGGQANSKFQKRTYYLAGGRLARPKHIELAVEACNALKAPLKIFGKAFAGYGDTLRAIAGPTIEFLGEVSDQDLAKLYGNAKALLYPSEDEDFGIMPVEAQGYGVPVIAYRSGGVKETVIENKTGVYFDTLTVESLIKAIKRLSNQAIKSEDCVENATRFSKERFKKEMKSFVTKTCGSNG
jgi:glycosyltransferase involved in cell wall biosynthesis